MFLLIFLEMKEESERNINVRNTNLLSLIPTLMGNQTGNLDVCPKN